MPIEDEDTLEFYNDWLIEVTITDANTGMEVTSLGHLYLYGNDMCSVCSKGTYIKFHKDSITSLNTEGNYLTIRIKL